MSRSTLIKILAALLIIIVALFLYAALKRAPEAEEEFVAESTLSPEKSAEGREFLRTLQNLRQIRLDGALFSDAAFRSLIDFSVTLTPEPLGRANPFAPLAAGETFGGRSSSQAATTTTP